MIKLSTKEYLEFVCITHNVDYTMEGEETFVFNTGVSFNCPDERTFNILVNGQQFIYDLGNDDDWIYPYVTKDDDGVILEFNHYNPYLNITLKIK